MIDNIPVTIRRSKRAKRIGLRIVPDRGVELVLPVRTSEQEGQAFLAAHADWIHQHAHWISPQAKLTESDRYTIPEHIHLPAIDLVLTIQHMKSSQSKRVYLRRYADTLFIYGKPQDFRCCANGMKRVLIDLAYEHISPQVRFLSQKMRFPYQTLSFRGQRTRWGSCSTEGKISLNYKLLFLKPDILRYVIVHELCHLKEMNHSERFWTLVESEQPDYRILKQRLKTAESDLPAWLF